MGSIHQDLEYFEVEDHHYHVDPRFIDEESEERARRATEYRGMFSGDTWHRTYRVVLTAFPVPEADDSYLIVKNLHTAVYTRDHAGRVSIRHRRRTSSRLPRAVPRGGDICPHHYHRRWTPAEGQGAPVQAPALKTKSPKSDRRGGSATDTRRMRS